MAIAYNKYILRCLLLSLLLGASISIFTGMIAVEPVFSQNDDAPRADTFSGGQAGIGLNFGLGRGLMIPLAPRMPVIEDPRPEAERIERDIENFRNSLSSDKRTLLVKLKTLLKYRLSHWEDESQGTDALGSRWQGYCEAILRKLPNDRCEYAWNEVYWLAASEYWRGDPAKKKEILKKWIEAERICGNTSQFSELARSRNSNTDSQKMPPLAPARLRPTQNNNTITGLAIAKYAKSLGENSPKRWLTDQIRLIYKCNIFVDSVYRGLGISLPWKVNKIPNVHNMAAQLNLDPKHFVKVWPTGNLTFKELHLMPGDIVLWDKDYRGTNLQHIAVLDGSGNMLYAGSINTGGYAQSKFNEYMKTIYALPTAIYRYKSSD